jgi:hypothetical protein
VVPRASLAEGLVGVLGLRRLLTLKSRSRYPEPYVGKEAFWSLIWFLESPVSWVPWSELAAVVGDLTYLMCGFPSISLLVEKFQCGFPV